MNMTKQLLQALRPQIQAALQSVLATNPGIGLELGNASFDPSSGTAKFQLLVAVKSATGTTDPMLVRAEADWAKYHEMYRLDPAWLGKTFERGGVTHTVLGLMPSRSKYPVLVSIDGKHRLFDASSIRAAFGQPDAPKERSPELLAALARIHGDKQA